MRKLLIILLLLALQTSLTAMPPTTEVVEMMRDEGRLQSVAAVHQDARMRGMNAPFDMNIADIARDDGDDIVYHTVCILVDFEDNEADQDSHPIEHYQDMLFSRDEYRTGSVRDWYLENSYGEVEITGEVYGWYRMPRDYAYYVQGVQGFGRYPRNAQGLARDALNAADDDVDFGDFDNDNNHVVEALFIVHAGQGAEYTGSDDMIWSHAWTVPENTTHDGYRFRRYAMEPEDGKIGVFGHELGHSLFGLPDLYDTSYESAGVGRWSMMSGGSHGNNGETPVHFDAWCKIRIGFIDPFPIVREFVNLDLDPVETDPNVLMLWRDDDFEEQYFLLENRQKVNFDRYMPGGGILIWHVDEGMQDNTNAWTPGMPSSPHNLVALEQADGRYDLERDNNSGDQGDPFPGTSWNITIGADTEPDSRDYRGRSTDITIHHIERLDSIRMRINISLDPNWEPERLNMFVLNRIPDDHIYPDPDERDNVVMTREIDLLRRLFREANVWDHQIGTELPDQLGAFNTIMYLESWREGNEPSGGLSHEEQLRIVGFLQDGKRLILVGPDVATNLQGDILWDYLNAEYISEGFPREDGNVQVVFGDEETRIAGQNFPFQAGEQCDHYIDEVDALDGSMRLFMDDANRPRGVITVGESGSRTILQPFLFGGLIDWGGEKTRLLYQYFQYFQLQLDAPKLLTENEPTDFRLISAWPNPFNSFLNLSFAGSASSSRLDIFDMTGRKVGEFGLKPGSGTLSWSPVGLSSGTYFLALQNSSPATSIRVVYLR